MPVEVVNATDRMDEAPPVRTVKAADLDGVVEELAAYHARFAPLFKRREQRAAAEIYLRGLLVADVPRKNVEAMVLRQFGAGPDADRKVRALQQFVGEGAWDDAAILADHHRLVDETLGEDDGVFIIDGSEIPKQGKHSVGVARQWCGATGKKENCQAGVFLGYASRKGYTLLDRRLYLPESWFTADYEERWRAGRIPDGTAFQTKPELAAAMVAAVRAERWLRARWAACDEDFGKDPTLLDQLDAASLWYLAEVPKDTMVWPLAEPDGKTARTRPQTWVPAQKRSRKGPVPTKERLHPDSPAKVRLDVVADQVASAHWRRYRILEGSKGPLVADFVAFRAVAVRAKRPGPEVWVLIRRKVNATADAPTFKFYLSNAPADTALDELVRVSGMRWPIESCFEEGKGELGLDQYELRFWPGWHHHMTLVILAHHFLVRLQRRLGQREGALEAAHNAAWGDVGRVSGPPRGVEGSAARRRGPIERGRGTDAPACTPATTGLRPARSAGVVGVPPAAQGRCLSFASQANLAPLG